MMARMTPVSLHFSDVPTGWKKIFTDKQQLATGFACSSRTVSPDKHCYRIICARYTQFQLPQTASKQGSVKWCCRCGMFAAFTTATIRLLGSIFIWAPPRTRPKIQHLCEDRKIFQPVSRMLILEIHIAFVAVPADVTSHSCHCPPHIFYAPDGFLIYFTRWWRKCGIVTVMTFTKPAETCWDVQLLSNWEHHSWVWHGKEPLSQRAANWRLEALTKN